MTEKPAGRAPMAAAAGCLAAGIALQWVLGCPAWLLLGLGAVAALALLRGKYGVPCANLLALAAALLAGAWAARVDGLVRADDIGRRLQGGPCVVTLVGTLAGEPELSRNGRAWRGWFRVEANVQGRPLSGIVQAQLPSRAGGFCDAERLRLAGLLREGRKEEARWLWVHGAAGVLTVADPEGVSRMGLRRDPWSRYRRWVVRQRQRLECWMDLKLDPASAGYLKGLLLGKGGEFSPELWERFRRTGTVHVLVVSGLHVGLIGFLALTVLAILRVPRTPRYLLLAFTLCGYCVLTGMKPPIVRSTLTGLLFCWAAALGIAASPVNLLGVAATAMLALCPRMLADASFQLSFAAVIGILAGSRLSSSRTRGSEDSPFRGNDGERGNDEGRENGRKRLTRLFGRTLRSAFAASCGAWLATAPILAWHFHSVAWVTPLANLVVVPWASLLIAHGFVLCLIGPVLPAASPPLLAGFRLLAAGLDRCVGWAAGLPGLFWRW